MYVGHRENHKDATYGTGEWARGQTKAVDSAAAAKMLRHPDVYRLIEDGDGVVHDPAPVAVAEIPHATQDRGDVQDALDVIQAMEPDALCAFVERNFQQKLDRRKSVGNLRVDAANLVHQFGMAG